jgi:hypothetical protein
MPVRSAVAPLLQSAIVCALVVLPVGAVILWSASAVAAVGQTSHHQPPQQSQQQPPQQLQPQQGGSRKSKQMLKAAAKAGGGFSPKSQSADDVCMGARPEVIDSNGERVAARKATKRELQAALDSCAVAVEMQTEERLASMSGTMGRVHGAAQDFKFRVVEPFTADSRFLIGSHSCVASRCAVPLSMYMDQSGTIAANSTCRLSVNQSNARPRFILRRVDPPNDPPQGCGHPSGHLRALSMPRKKLAPFWCDTGGGAFVKSPARKALGLASASSAPTIGRVTRREKPREVCVYACAYDGQCNSWRPLGSTIHAALRFVWHETGGVAAGPWVLTLEKHGWW